jgi:hypothetical protein
LPRNAGKRARKRNQKKIAQNPIKQNYSNGKGDAVTHPAEDKPRVLVIQPRNSDLAATDLALRDLLPTCRVDFVGGRVNSRALLANNRYEVIVVDAISGASENSISAEAAQLLGFCPEVKLVLFTEQPLDPEVVGADGAISKSAGQPALAREIKSLLASSKTDAT